ncbi:MAG: nucleoside-diphosphate sugar epimerase, partial [Limisphaerales bacterium]
QTRCFCHINDTVESLLRLQSSSAALGEVINIGSTEEISIIDLARRVVALLNSTSEIRLVPYSEAYPSGGFQDMPRRKPSIEKLRRITGFTPGTPLDATIASVAQSLQSLPPAP